MIRHCVFFRFGAHASEREISDLLDGFFDLQGQIDGVIQVQAGPNLNPEGLDQGFRHGIIIDFTDEATIEGYLTHSAHLSLVERILPQLVDGRASIIPFDI